MRRLPALDGLRALAVLLVLVQHGFFTDMHPILSPGPIGVRLFFVLSGFLITGLLIRARTDAEAAGVSMGTVWRAFLGRRAVRIFPLAYLALFVAWLLGTPALTADAGWYALYLGNLHTAFYGHASDGLAFFWSLAVEEQFYVVWPCVILFLPRRAWQPIALGALIVAALARIGHYELGGPLPAYVLTWCRMDALAWGAFLAMRRVRLVESVLGIGAVVLIAGLSARASVHLSGLESICVIASGLAVSGLSTGCAGRLFSLRPLVGLGAISYGVYVWSGLMPWLILPLIERQLGITVMPAHGSLAGFLVLSAATIGLAVVSWQLFERPLNDLKRWFPYLPAQSARLAIAA